MNVTGRYLVQGHAQGKALVLSEPLSFGVGLTLKRGRSLIIPTRRSARMSLVAYWSCHAGAGLRQPLRFC